MVGVLGGMNDDRILCLVIGGAILSSGDDVIVVSGKSRSPYLYVCK